MASNGSDKAESAPTVEDLIQSEIETALHFYLDELSPDGVSPLDEFEKSQPRVFSELFECIKGGKLTRGKRFIEVAEPLMNERDIDDTELLFQGAAALELFQTAMLIHDDIIDGDEMRRGRPSSWAALSKEKAILLGDLVLSAADWVFDEMVFDMTEDEMIEADTAKEVRRQWHTMKRDCLIGQVYDVDQSQLDLVSLSDEELSDALSHVATVAKMKTASYTTVAPNLLGLMIGSDTDFADEDEVRQLVADGVDFQLENDKSGVEKDLKNGNTSGWMIAEEARKRGVRAGK